MRDCSVAGLQKKRKTVRDKVGQSASEARHHGLRWDQSSFCVSEDLVRFDTYMTWLWTSRFETLSEGGWKVEGQV